MRLQALSGPHRAVLALGSNLGNRRDNLQGAIDALADTPGIRVNVVSPLYVTEAVGGPEDQPEYFNAVILVDTFLTPDMLLDRANAVEEAFQRVRTEHWGPRTLDVDIIVYGDKVVQDPHLTIPHPRAHERAFVLAPWVDADPDAEIPGHGRAADLLAKIGTAGIARRDDLELRLPE
ncbi:MAG: 2-amino-4-hydroxy-6-hydroxymethyldihydropteridine diphosphokinase [Streptomycetaceae bacterium]|nr:2-amino-4-hydroxy-6-hydroxymethyldihydropteridine diphosphokinase [Streptomycetaceae bacterium]